AIVAAEADRGTIIERYGIEASRVHVIPNYVDTAAFRPMPAIARESGRITFVGRLDDQKNVMALIEAVEDFQGVALVIIGYGPLRDQLQEAATHRRVSATFLGTRPKAEVPTLLPR